MTCEEFCKQHLEERGLWSQEAEAVAALMKRPNEDHWSKQVDGYPDEFRATLALSAEGHAIRYLEKESPEHFALALLRGEV